MGRLHSQELENQVRIRSLPSGFSALRGLESLLISGASLAEVPAQLASLTGLTSLVVRYNHAPLHVSQELSSLVNLVCLSPLLPLKCCYK
jgi:Leucine-rich repeat (LRR) protein